MNRQMRKSIIIRRFSKKERLRNQRKTIAALHKEIELKELKLISRQNSLDSLTDIYNAQNRDLLKLESAYARVLLENRELRSAKPWWKKVLNG